MMSVGVTCPHPSHTRKMVGLVNGSIRHQDKSLRITVVGAGIAGLACAVALRRQGHVVEVTVGNFRTSLVALTAFFAINYRFMINLGSSMKSALPSLCPEIRPAL